MPGGKGSSAGGRGLNLTARLSVSDAVKEAKRFKDSLKETITVAQALSKATGQPNNKSFDVKPLTEYQAGLLKIKQETLEFAKAEVVRKKAERDASLATQAALKEETRLKREQLAIQNQRKPTQISNSQAEIDAYKRAQQGSVLYTSAINNETVARARLNTEAARTAVANGTLSASGSQYIQSTAQQTQAANQNVLSKKQLAQVLAEEKLRQTDATRELKNNAREMLNAKGSLEQRKAALERLITVYGRMSIAERQSAAGQRMNTIIKDLGVQINKIDPTKIEKVAKEIKKVPESLPKLSESSYFSKLFESISSGALSVLAPLALIGSAWTAVRAIFSHNVEISDAFADVRRTAKLSNEEVNNLADGLKDLNTRTNLEGLLDIGFIGGRLGVAKKELPDFIKQVDELAVVLKKELPGGAEAVAEALGRIVTIYKVTQAEGVSLGTALSKVGSNLLELAHSGPVTVKYLQDFTLGVAGTAASAKLSIPVISAYGAVLGESGQIASSAALSVTRLVTGLTTKTGKYAAIAQLADSTLTVEKFTKIVNTDTKQALDLFFKGLKAGNPVATEFAARLGSVGITTGKVTNAVKIVAENQDKLADRIAKGSVAFENGTTVAHNFEIANDTLGSSVDKLGNSITNLTTNPNSNFYTFFKGLIDGATKSVSALDILISTVKGLTTDPKKFIGDSAAKARAETLAQINEEAAKIAEAAYRNKDTNIDGERLTILKEEIKIRDVLNTKYLTEKIALANNKDASLAQINRFNETETKLQKQVALVRELNKLRNKNGKVDVIGTGELTDNTEDVRTTDVIKSEIKALELANKKLGVESGQFKSNVREIVKLRKELKLALGGKDTEGIAAENKDKQAEKRAKDLGDKLGEFRKKSVREQLDGDAKEAASIKDKYDAMRKEVDDFYSAAENRGKNININGQKYTKSQAMGLISADQKTETSASAYNNATDQLKKDFDKQKDLYAEFEESRVKIGATASAKIYKDRINTELTYAQAIKSELDKIPEKSIRNPQEEKRFLLLSENYEAATDAEKKANAKLLEDYQTYTQQKEAIENKYLKHAADLRKLGQDQAASEAIEAGKNDIDRLSETFLQKSRAYKRAADEAVILTREATINQVKALNKILESGILPPAQATKVQNELNKLKFVLKLGVDEGNVRSLQDEFNRVSAQLHVKDDQGNDIILNDEDYKSIITRLAEIQGKINLITNPTTGKAKSAFAKGLEESFNYLKGTTKEVAEGASKDLAQLSSGFGKLSSALGGNNTQAGYLLDTIGQLAEAGSQAADAFASFSSGDIIGGITKTIGAVTSILSIGKKVKEMNAAARQEVLDYYDAAIKGETEYQAMLRKRDLESAARGKNSYNSIIAQLEAIKKQSPELEKAYASVFGALQGQQFVDGMGSEHGTWLRKAKTWDILASLAGSDYNRLEELYSQGKLKDAAKSDFEALKALREEMESLGLNVQDLQKQLGELLTGTSVSGLADGLSQLFANGTRSAQDFGKSFEEIIKNSLLSSFRVKYLEDALQPFYDELANLMKGSTPTEDQIAALKNKYLEVGQEADAYLKNIEKITGQSLTSSSSTSTDSALKKNITQITSDQANALEGITRGTYDQTKQLVVLGNERNLQIAQMSASMGNLYHIATQHLLVSTQIAANTLRTADNTEKLTAIDDTLKAIAKNTTGGTLRGGGFG